MPFVKNNAHIHILIKAITPHRPHSRNQVVGNGGEVELRRLERENIPFSY